MGHSTVEEGISGEEEATASEAGTPFGEGGATPSAAPAMKAAAAPAPPAALANGAFPDWSFAGRPLASAHEPGTIQQLAPLDKGGQKAAESLLGHLMHAHMTDQDYRDREFRDRGFRCLQPTEVVLLDGSRATIQAKSYRTSLERDEDTPRQRAALRLYSIQRSGQSGIEIISELELEEKIGSEHLHRLA